MELGGSEFLRGWRWVSGRGRNDCQLCASLHGKEFYFHPTAGQTSVQDMPDVPLHPNCDCTIDPIMDHEAMVREEARAAARRGAANAGREGSGQSSRPQQPNDPQVSEYYYKGRKELFGLAWCNDGRSWLDGPAYGNYGGQRWSRGRNPDNIREDEPLNYQVEPIDRMDEAFQDHDIGYENCKGQEGIYLYRCQIEVDRRLVDNLRRLSDDGTNWEREFKGPGDREHAKRYRDWAIWYFEGRVDRYDVEKSENWGGEYEEIEAQ